MPLFRPAAMQSQSQRSLGRVALQPTRYGLPIAVLAVIFLVFVSVLLYFGQSSRKVWAYGRLVPTDGILTVRSQADAVLAKLYVQEGQVVHAGQVLAELSTDQLSNASNGLSLTRAIDAQLDIQRQQLIAEQQSLTLSKRTRHDAITQKRHVAEQRLAILRQQQKLSKQQFQQTNALWQRMRSHAKTSLSTLQLQQFEAAALNADSARNQATLAILTAQTELDQLSRDESSLTQEIAGLQRANEKSLAQISESIIRNGGSRDTVIRAPRDGIVSSLAISPGQSISRGARLMDVMPNGGDLLAEIWAPTNAIGGLQTGQVIAMQLDALPYQRFGFLKGVIAQIAKSPTSASEITALSGVVRDAPAFRIVVHIQTEHLSDGSVERALLAGMSLQANLVLESRRILHSIFAASGVNKSTSMARGRLQYG